MNNQIDLEKKLSQVEKIFPINQILNEEIDESQIKKYYKGSSFAYKYFHSFDGAVHMSLNYDGIFNKEGYKTQLLEISEHIKYTINPEILELGCGKGFNSRTLNSFYKNSTITGLDFSQKHLAIANSKNKVKNKINYVRGDFHELPFNDEKFDFLYELESICHAKNHESVLNEAYRVLKKNGKFILYDGFRCNNFDTLNSNLQKATILVEKSMAVEKFYPIEDWLLIAKKVGFQIEEQTNISEAIVPTLMRLNKLARGFYKYPLLSNFLKRILPNAMLKNSIAGLLMPSCVSNGSLLYYRLVLTK